jgi:hypothetical protein
MEDNFIVEFGHLILYKNKLSTRLIERGMAQTTTRSPGMMV